MHAKLLQLYQTLYNPLDCSPPGSSAHGILQARVLEWVAMPSFRGSLGIESASFKSPALKGGFFITSTTWEALQKHVCAKSLQLCLTLCNPMD